VIWLMWGIKELTEASPLKIFVKFLLNFLIYSFLSPSCSISSLMGEFELEAWSEWVGFRKLCKGNWEFGWYFIFYFSFNMILLLILCLLSSLPNEGSRNLDFSSCLPFFLRLLAFLYPNEFFQCSFPSNVPLFHAVDP
jgi:hypothetical protein